MPKCISGILFLSIFLGFGVNGAEAAPIKILSNSRHAFADITSTINLLLGTGHVGTDIIVHSTSMNSGYAGGNADVALSSTSRYDESGVLVSSQAPYQLYTSSFTGYSGDTVTQYNYSATYDIAHNYAFTVSINSPPPAFHIAPGGGGWASASGVEWTIDPAIFNTSSLSSLTAANAGIMASLRYNHPTWNWFDVKAALRQTGANWATGYNNAAYGFGQVNYATANAFTDGQIALQPPVAASSIILDRISFTLYPFKQTRRVKEVLFQFASAPSFQSGELTLNAIQALGGTKITEYTGTTATEITPSYAAITNAYFVWFTADNATDSAANFSRIDTYSVLGPTSQDEVSFDAAFDIVTPATNTIITTTSPTFTWEAASSYLGITKYQLFIDGVLDKDNIAGTSTTPTSALSDGSHTWYVKVFNGGGATADTTSTPTININTSYASGYTFYVDNVLGSDNNTGTQTLPWATLSKAATTVLAGDTVVIVKNAGTPYRETLTPAHNGTSGSPIIFRGADTNSKPEIWGSTDASAGWSVYGGGGANTYQRSTSVSPQVVAAGASLTTLTKKAEGVSAVTLNPGEWFWVSGVLYYRLASGESIGSLRIEAATRDNGIVSTAYTQYQDIIVRYANSTGASLATTESIAQGIEVYDSYVGILIGSGNTTVKYSVAAGNKSYGVYTTFPDSTYIYNSTFYGNVAGGGYLSTFITDNVTIRNNVFSGNTGYSFSFLLYFPPASFTMSHNFFDVAGDATWNTRKGTDNQELVDPLLIDPDANNFALNYLSLGIDTGIAIPGLTTDILGNHIYGLPDLGAYEYQPPYTMGIDGIDIAGAIRVYKDGKFRNTLTTAGTFADMSITPVGGFGSGDYAEWMNIIINTWDIAGDWNKNWTETSTTLGATSTVHTVGDLQPDTYYNVKVDTVLGSDITGPNCSGGVCLSNALGKITFTYAGGYSAHTFDVSLGDNTIPALSGGLPAGVLHRDITENTLSLTTTENSTCKYGTVPNVAYADIPSTFSTTGGTSHSTSLSGLTDGESYEYYVRCQDATGNIHETDYVIYFSIAPASQHDEANIGAPKLKAGKVTQKLTREKIYYLKKNKFFLFGNDENLANGVVEIFREGKRKSVVHADEEGKWKSSLRIKDPGRYEFYFRYKNEHGTVVATQERRIVLDTESPVFLSFPAVEYPVIIGSTPLFWEASDNEKLGKYSIFFAGKKYVQEAGSFILPKNAPRGWQTFRVQAEDRAGNQSEWIGRIFVRE